MLSQNYLRIWQRSQTEETKAGQVSALHQTQLNGGWRNVHAIRSRWPLTLIRFRKDSLFPIATLIKHVEHNGEGAAACKIVRVHIFEVLRGGKSDRLSLWSSRTYDKLLVMIDLGVTELWIINVLRGLDDGKMLNIWTTLHSCLLKSEEHEKTSYNSRFKVNRTCSFGEVRNQVFNYIQGRWMS